MKRLISITLFLLLITTPSFAADEVHGDITLGLRTTHYSGGEKSAKYDEYLDKSNGLFGDLNLMFDSEEYYAGLALKNPTLDDQSYELTLRKFGLGKARFYFDELNHQMSKNALTPSTGLGSDYVTTPDVVPPVSDWRNFDYNVKRKVYGTEFTIDPTDSPFYGKASVEQQRHEGKMPWGTTLYSGIETAMPVDYTTDNLMLESGYRSKETTAVFTGGFSQFDNANEMVTTVGNGRGIQEYSTPADNYSYNLGGRLVQRLSKKNLLALKTSYTRNISDVNFGGYTSVDSTKNGYDGDVEYIRAAGALTTQWSTRLDTRLFYSYVDRNNNSDKITTLDNGRTNHRYEYDKNEAGLDVAYRLNKNNKLSSGYEFSYINQNREDADSSMDNLVFVQLKNTSLDWLSTKIRLEYMNRDTDTDYSAEDLEDSGEIRKYFTPSDYADKDRYKAKLDFGISPPVDWMSLGLSYAFLYNDYDATELGVQSEQRHEYYLDVNFQLPADMRLNTYAGYEFSKNKKKNRQYSTDPNPSGITDSSNFNWNEDTTYDFFVLGGSLSVPVTPKLELVFTADCQWNDGTIDFDRSSAAGDSLATIDDADDYYKTQLGTKGIYQVNDAMSVTLGYFYEKSNLDEWQYNDYEYDTGSFYQTGAYTDSDYETHQFYVTTSYKF
jgi:MtrB/PioB family decaheme-associated outer membrane protein